MSRQWRVRTKPANNFKKKTELSSRALEAKPGQQSGNGRKDGTLRKTKKLLEIKKNTGISNPQEMEG